MNEFPFETTYCLVPRGGRGVACDEEGVCLGPVVLVEKTSEFEKPIYRRRQREEIRQTLRLAYDRQKLIDDFTESRSRLTGEH